MNLEKNMPLEIFLFFRTIEEFFRFEGINATFTSNMFEAKKNYRITLMSKLCKIYNSKFLGKIYLNLKKFKVNFTECVLFQVRITLSRQCLTHCSLESKKLILIFQFQSIHG